MSLSSSRWFRNRWLVGLGLALLTLGGAAAALYHPPAPAARPAAVFVPEPEPPAADAEQVHQLCGSCHAYPPADTFPKRHWRQELRQAYEFLRNSKQRPPYPSFESVARYYEDRAPDQLPLWPRPAPAGEPPVRFDRAGYRFPGQQPPRVTNVTLGHLSDPRRLDVVACDATTGQVLALRPYEPSPAWRVLARLTVPAHAEVIDLDGDGIPDVLVADLGSFFPSNDRAGSVVWLRGAADGTFTPITLLEGVGRVADVQAADFCGTGKKDLVVGVFGWRTTGEVLLLENRTTDWAEPKFVPRVLDDRHGTIHVPVADLNGDGKPDFVALISQEHETIVAFLNEGGGRFRKETIYTAPHPAYGSSGIQLVDLNGDGKLDVLYTNGDTLDRPYLLKPYHGIQWLENRGTFPFVHHPIAPMYGVMRALAADVDGDGDLDIIAVSYLPEETFPPRGDLDLDSVVLLEQVRPGQFVRHSLEAGTCDHFTCAIGDWVGDGGVHLVTGNFNPRPQRPAADGVVLWKNLKGKK
jgi:hypothetical protein